LTTRANPNFLMSAQEAVASAFTDAGVSVIWDATAPWADVQNKIIHLRPIPDRLSDEEIEDVRGDCDHELGHIKFTSPAALTSSDRVMVRTIANSIEDGRVDRLMAQEWFGCGENLERSADRAISRIVATKRHDDLGRRARALCGLSLIASGRTPNLVIVELGEDIRPLYEPVADLLAKLSDCQTTDECVAISTNLADRWNWQPISADHKETAAAVAEDEAAAEVSHFALSVASERKSSVTNLAQTPINTYRSKTINDRVEVIKKPSFELNRLFGHFYEGIRKVVPTLRRRLLMEFRSAGKKGARHLKAGKLDERSLFRVALDDQRLYKADRRAIVHRSNVTLLVDCSASMTHPARPEAYPGEPAIFRTKLFIAAQAAAAVSLVLDLLKIQNECLAFTTLRAPVSSQLGFERVRPIRHLTIKPFNRRAHACRNNFISLALFEHCSENIDGEAILWASRRLLTKPKGGDSPVLIVFSDGEPASQPEGPEILARHLRESIKQAEKAGIAVFGVGIASNAVKAFYKNAVVVSDVTNLVADFYELLRKVLRERLALAR
jgi:hypothetical protein